MRCRINFLLLHLLGNFRYIFKLEIIWAAVLAQQYIASFINKRPWVQILLGTGLFLFLSSSSVSIFRVLQEGAIQLILL